MAVSITSRQTVGGVMAALTVVRRRRLRGHRGRVIWRRRSCDAARVASAWSLRRARAVDVSSEDVGKFD